MTIQEAKAAMRTAAYARRRIAKADANPAPAIAALVEVVRHHPVGSVVSAYAAIRTEIDPMPAMEVLAAEGYRLCLPVVIEKDAPLVFRPWMPGLTLVSGAFGAPIPEHGPELVPDVVIAPLLAFDTRGYRLGYGGGYYDRTLAKLRVAKSVAAYGFAFAAQEVEVVPTEPTDIALDAIITEAGERRVG